MLMFRTCILIAALALQNVCAEAAVVYISTSPATWKMENYVGQYVAVWNTGSSCAGLLSFSASATSADMNRFWATVTVAKSSDKKIFIRYDDATAGCQIQSFGFDTQ